MKKKILIVEDEKVLLYLLEAQFIEEGFDVICKQNGKEGLASALKNHPDIIILDLLMPVMDGMKMLDKLRKDSWGKKVKVIILTNLSDAEKTKQCFDKGVLGCLIKSDTTISNAVKIVKEKLK